MNTKTNTEIAIDEIRRRIFSGVLLPGENYLESELASMLGMSRTPVREAALIVQAQGLVEVQPRKGVRIVAIDANEIDQIHDILTELECLSARCAAQLGYKREDLTGVLAALDGMDAALICEDRFEWSRNDDAFHLEVCKLSRKKHLLQAVHRYFDQIRRARYLMLHQSDTPWRSTEEHRASVEAILSSDPQEADRLHREHCQRTKTKMMEIVKRVLDAKRAA